MSRRSSGASRHALVMQCNEYYYCVLMDTRRAEQCRGLDGGDRLEEGRLDDGQGACDLSRFA